MAIIPAENSTTSWHTAGAAARQESGVAWPTVTNSCDFAIGAEASPAEAVQQARDLLAMFLPLFLAGCEMAGAVAERAADVLAELVDLTARRSAGAGLSGRVVVDGAHVIVSVGDMAGRLPAPGEEPGLQRVRRLVADMGQYDGDRGGRVTWAAVAA
ncbi:hypothetical protein HHL19_35890 [Streptomyces sp. R302]|uniref:hypothetical protein n=1 Tax=unclassified Streptomyces TaxID=2593676 RepID=UPI00145C6BFF|nr:MULTISPECIES: hypothetical protein [unclassified Streptomyces]NML55077.1 hypothetical protein [Streptomyces sp. R301]NML83893.1 hypothetical protein [Streptomyces sp. R302]